MLVIKVELHPFGDKEKAKEIHRLFIWNEGPVSLYQCQYGYMILPPDSEETYDYPRDVPEDLPVLKGTLDHTRSDGALELLRKVLSHD